MQAPKENAFPLTSRPADDVIVRGCHRDVRIDEFLARAAALSQRLPDRACVINLSSDRYEFLLGFCASVIAGQCTLMPANRQPATLADVASSYTGSYVLGGEPLAGFDHVAVDTSATATSRIDAPRIRDDQLCAIVFTSGSTGVPQPNRKYWRTLRHGTASNARLVLDTDARDGTLSLVATVPSQHMWGFEMSILLPLLANVAVGDTTPFFPADILGAMAALPRPRALVSSPVHLDAILGGAPGDVAIDRIYTATAPMRPEAARRLEAQFGARVVDVFGCSESGIIAARRVSDEEDWRLADAFRLEHDHACTLIVADHLDEPVPLTDRVELLDGRRFRWIGRDSDMVNIAGKRGSLTDIHQRLNSLPGVTDAVVFMPNENAKRLAALVVAPRLRPSDILNALRDSIDPVFLPRPVYIVSSLPRQETGKLSRRDVLRLFGELRQRGRADAQDEEESSED